MTIYMYVNDLIHGIHYVYQWYMVHELIFQQLYIYLEEVKIRKIKTIRPLILNKMWLNAVLAILKYFYLSMST